MNERTQLRKARRYEKLDEDAINKATTALLRSPDGRKFVGWLLDITRYGQQPFTGNALSTAFACGELNVGQQFLARATDVDPEGFLAFLKERAHDDDARTLDLNGTTSGPDRNNYYDPDDAPAE